MLMGFRGRLRCRYQSCPETSRAHAIGPVTAMSGSPIWRRATGSPHSPSGRRAAAATSMGSNSDVDPAAASGDAPSSSCRDASPSPRRGKKRQQADDHDVEEAAPAAKGRKLTMQEEMQLKLLASLPSMREPLRDARGRRRSTCISNSEIVEAGLAALIGESTVNANEATSPTGSPQRRSERGSSSHDDR